MTVGESEPATLPAAALRGAGVVRELPGEGTSHIIKILAFAVDNIYSAAYGSS